MMYYTWEEGEKRREKLRKTIDWNNWEDVKKNIPEIVRCMNWYGTLCWIPENIKENERFVRIVVLMNWRCIFYLPQRFLQNKIIIKYAISQSGSVLIKIPEEYKTYDLCKFAIDENIRWFQYISKKLKDDEEFVKHIIDIDPNEFQHASKRLRNDPKMCLIVFLKNNNCSYTFGKYIKLCIKFKKNKMNDNKIFEALKKEYHNKYCPRQGTIYNYPIWDINIKYN